MGTATKVWLAVIVLFISLVSLLILDYQNYKEKLIDQPPYFELYFAETFLEEDESSPFDIVSQAERRTLNWQIDLEQLENLESNISLSLKNISEEKFYYTSWGTPFSRLRQDLIIYKEGKADTIPFYGFGCGTGIFLVPLSHNETISNIITNPLVLNPHSNYELAIQSENFPEQFREAYGDSVSIIFSQSTYSTPWSKHKSQMIFSDYITISTEKVLNNWRKARYTKIESSIGFQINTKNHENSIFKRRIDLQ